MPRKTIRGVDGERIDAPESSQPGCPSCNSDDPQTRARHRLVVARNGLDALRSHLQRFYALDTSERQRYINEACQWVASQMEMWAGYADPTTGATLPWWRARAQAHAMPTKPDDQHPDAPWKRAGALTRIPAAEVQSILVAALQQQAKDPWAQGHILLMETGVNRPGRGRDAAAACRQFAQRWPQDTEAWERGAQWWKAGAPDGGLALTRQPGEDG